MIKPTSKRLENAEIFGSLYTLDEENLGILDVLKQSGSRKQKKLS